jgi:hypothetical protein
MIPMAVSIDCTTGDEDNVTLTVTRLCEIEINHLLQSEFPTRALNCGMG